jgi:U4/U6.U5 tri-snRNP component SNU23
MSESKRAAKGSANVVRRTWDKNKYEQKAKDREEYGDEHVDKPEVDEDGVRDLQEFRAADKGAAGPAGSKRAWLQPRPSALGFEKQAGHTQVLMNAEVQKKATGWYCDVCECLLRDSASYLDHINGKKHQRKIGYSMRTQRVGVEQVRDRLATVTEDRRRADEEMKRLDGLDTTQEYERILEAREQDAHAQREAKKEAKKRKRDEAAAAQQAKDEEDVDDESAAMNAMMGFGGFGGSKKGK